MTVSPESKPRRVKAAFIGVVAVALTLVMCVFAVALLLVERNIRDIDLQERSSAVVKLFEQKLDKDANLMLAVLRAIKGNAAVERALADRDREALARLSGPLFEALRGEHRLTHLYFHRSDLVNLYRAHSPDQFGDEVDRVTTGDARRKGAPASGLELGPLGTLTLRSVMPWERNGELLGYIEIGEEIAHLIDEVRRSLNVGLLVLVEKPRIAPDEWRRGLAMMNRQGDWNRFVDHVALAETGERLPASLDRATLGRLMTGRTDIIETGERSLHLAMVPLDDASGHHIGELVVMHDITGMQSTFRWSVGLVTLAGVLVAAGVLGIFHIALDRVDRDYQRQHELELQVLRMDADHQRLLQVEKLSALGTMVGGVAHQLNNPLVGVVNMSQLAARTQGNPPQTQNLLAEIRRAGEDCRAFVQRMLEFSKVSSFVSKPTPMGPLIEETVLMFRQAENRRHPLEVRLPAADVVLDVDPLLIRHALFNLLLNASQAVSGDEPIVIALERTTDPVGNVARWTLSVTNQGLPIPPDVMKHVFEPFFTTRSDGTGLGLPVVQHVALLHGGQVTATSEPGHGTRFAISLPVDASSHG